MFKVKENYDVKLKELRTKEKELEHEMVKLNAGKQGFFSSIVSKLEESKTKVSN